MNWKDVLGQITQSGKFEIENTEGYKGEVDGLVYNIEGNKEAWFMVYYDGENYIKAKDCKLIARPVSSLSTKELIKCGELLKENTEDGYNDWINCGHGRDKLIKVVEIYSDYTFMFLYLLSIGVYPFEDETDVIFKNKEQS